MKTFVFVLSVFQMLCGACLRGEGTDTNPINAGWQSAVPGTVYQFPSDHALHPDYKTEWWYFTGNLQGNDGHQYGYELTFFRQGVIPPTADPSGHVEATTGSRFLQADFKFAHFAISDLDGQRFYYTQRTSRGAFGETGFGTFPLGESRSVPAPGPTMKLVWLEDWSVRVRPDGGWDIGARSSTPESMSVDFTVRPAKELVIQGLDGVSQKAEGIGNASHYYSFTRLETTGQLQLGKNPAVVPVHGLSWFDHEWASSQLAPDQVGWDWFCLQFEDKTELMLYAMRRRDGSVDPASSGTWIDATGHPQHLRRDQIDLRPVGTWRSAKTGATYPVEWEVRVASLSLGCRLAARLQDQELVLPPISYWEGAIQAKGQRAGQPVKAVGYMELTGYATAMKGLQGQSPSQTSDLPRTPR